MYNKLFDNYGHHCEVESTLNQLKMFQQSTNPLIRCWYNLRRVNEASWEGNQFLRSQLITDNEHYKHMKHIFLIHPFSKLRTGWEVFMSIVFLLEFITIPLELGSLQGQGSEKLHTNLTFVILRFTLDTMCVCDICMNFFTGYIDKKKGEVIMEPLKIIKRYMQTYFAVDLCSSVPGSVIAHLSGRVIDPDPLLNPTQVNMFEIIVVHISMFKILRLFSFLKYCRHFMKLANNNARATLFLRLLIAAVVYLLLVHYVVCTSISVSYYTEPQYIYKKKGVIYFNKNPPFQYIPTPYSNMALRRPNASLINGDVFTFYEFYIRFLYTSTIMWTRTGSGFRTIRSPYSQLYISIIWFIALIFYFIFIAYIMAILSSFNASKHKYIEMVQQLREYMRYKQLPEHLQRRLIRNYEYRFQKTYFRESIIMRNISGHLRQEILMHSCQKLVEAVVFFKNLPTKLLVQIVTCMQVEVFLENDVITRANTVGTAMYFIATGTVAIYTTNGLEIVHLDDGHHFGEIAMVKSNHKRVASVIAIEMSEMYRLDQDDFVRAILPYPDVLNKIELIASERMEHTAGLNYDHTHMFNKLSKKKDMLRLKKSLFYLL